LRPIPRQFARFAATAFIALAPAAQASADDVIYTTADEGYAFATIDPASGSALTLGPTGHSSSFAATVDVDGTVWTLVNGYTSAQIAVVDPATGAATPRPNATGQRMYALEIASDGTMYGIGVDDRRLHRIDKTTGVATAVGPSTGISEAMDLAFDCNGDLWATSYGQLWVVDTATGTATAKASITGIADATAVMGLMVDGDCRMLATTYRLSGALYEVDPGTGAATLIGDTGLWLPHGGDITAFESDTDAPATTDDVPAGFVNAPPSVTLNALDGGGSGVARIYCEIGTNPPAPTTSSPVYDPDNKPKLAHGERIRYFAVDNRGNIEPARTSAPAKVDALPPTTTDDVPVTAQHDLVAVTLTSTDNPRTAGDSAGVEAIHYEIGTNPPAPTTASPRYDPANKPVLRHGERIRYFAVDAAGNAETPKNSRTLTVEIPRGETPPRASQRHVTINLRSRYNGRRVRAVRATIDGRKAKVRKTARGYRVRVDMRGHDCTPVRVRIKIHLKGGRALTIRRVFRTCTPGATPQPG
jgi:hypothetical protein